MKDTNYCYGALLSNEQWKAFRHHVIQHHDNTCEICGKKFIYGLLQVHHKVYRKDTKPWEYDLSEVQCLCIKCHSRIHEKLIEESKKIPFLNKRGKEINIPNELLCEHCGGFGSLKKYSHIMHGLCLYCFGSGIKNSHYFTRIEAERYSHIIYNQWCEYHEDSNGDLDSLKFSGKTEVKKWLLDLNNKH